MPKYVQLSLARHKFGIKHRNVFEAGTHGPLLNQLWSIYFQEKKYVTHRRYPFFYMEAKFGPSENSIDISRDEMFQNSLDTLF